MATLLARLADAASRRRRIVIGAWLALLLAGGWFSLHQSDRLSGGGWEVPGSASVRVSNALDAFPKFSSPALSVLVTGRSAAAVRSRLAAVRTATARDPNLRPDRPHLFAGGRAALLPVTYVGPTGAAIDVATRARHALVQTTPETRTRLIGQPAIWSNFQEVAKHQLARGEATGFPLILIILLAGFGTLVAALAPLAVGLAAVFLTGAVVYWLSHATEMSIYVTNMAPLDRVGDGAPGARARPRRAVPAPPFRAAARDQDLQPRPGAAAARLGGAAGDGAGAALRRAGILGAGAHARRSPRRGRPRCGP